MSKRPSLADSLRVSLEKGVHVETAVKIAQGLPPISDEAPPPTPEVAVKPVHIEPPALHVVRSQVAVHEPNVADVMIAELGTSPASDQAITTTINRANKQASDQADKQTSNEATEQTNKQSIQQDSRQTGKQPDSQTIKQTVEQSAKQSIGQLPEQSIKQLARHAWLPFNEKQGRILLYLYKRGNGLTNMDLVCSETGIAYGTARSSIGVLMSEGYVTSKTRHNGHAFRGFEYTLNNHLCSLYVSRIRGEQSSEQSSWQWVQQSIKQAVGPYSSSVLEENLTTAKTGLLTDPELRFWSGVGVTEKQVQNWMNEFQMSDEDISLSLLHCRFDILNRGDVQKPANWFYKILVKNGFYPQPENYRSLLEIRAEALQKQQGRDREAKNQLDAAEFERKFQMFLEDTESLLYRGLFGKISEFTKAMLLDGDESPLENELRMLFKEHLEAS